MNALVKLPTLINLVTPHGGGGHGVARHAMAKAFQTALDAATPVAAPTKKTATTSTTTDATADDDEPSKDAEDAPKHVDPRLLLDALQAPPVKSVAAPVTSGSDDTMTTAVTSSVADLQASAFAAMSAPVLAAAATPAMAPADESSPTDDTSSVVSTLSPSKTADAPTALAASASPKVAPAPSAPNTPNAPSTPTAAVATPVQASTARVAQVAPQPTATVVASSGPRTAAATKAVREVTSAPRNGGPSSTSSARSRDDAAADSSALAARLGPVAASPFASASALTTAAAVTGAAAGDKTMTTANPLAPTAGEPTAAAPSGGAASATPATQAAVDAANSAVNQAALRHAATGVVEHPDLGRIDVSARLHDGQVDVRIAVERPDAAATLTSHAVHMARDVREADIPLRQVDIDTSSRSGARDASAQTRQGEHDESGRRSAGRAATDSDSDDVQPASSTPSPARVRIVL